jgi:hypothetical protein
MLGKVVKIAALPGVQTSDFSSRHILPQPATGMILPAIQIGFSHV